MHTRSTRFVWMGLALFMAMPGSSCKGPSEPAPVEVDELGPVPSQVEPGNLDETPTSEGEQAIELVRRFVSEWNPSPDWTFSVHWGERIQKWVVVARRPPREGSTQGALEFFYVDPATATVEKDNID
jgi:hypothetical protein